MKRARLYNNHPNTMKCSKNHAWVEEAEPDHPLYGECPKCGENVKDKYLQKTR